MSQTERLARATAHLPAPLAVVDLDAFDANAADLRRRARGVPVRVASKSVRVRSLVVRALDAGFQGVMAFSLAEALWLVQEGVRDVLVGYPTVDRDALARLAVDARARREVTLMVDDVAQLALLDAALRTAAVPAGTGDLPDVAVCLDVDASLWLDAGPLHVHLGTRRSPLRTPDDVAALARRVEALPGARLRGLMFYEAQVAGLPDTNPAVRLVKKLSVAELYGRRTAVVEAVGAAVGRDVELVNSGGTGSLETSSAGPTVTEVTAGSGLFVPGLFDGYRAFDPRPSAFFGIDVARVPAPGWATAFGGGYVASGPAGRSRLPRVATPGWSLTGTEGAGEVMTPLRRGRGAAPLAVGDRVWMRHAKAGELMERFDVVHLVRGDTIVESVPTYRGEGHTFG
ncbi:alanine racemase [Isoptericola sp. NPDC019693]|uniref:alanine racemase n=1 Tax=Isoptericola sp. NPDC019693 TaxID=3364009 RepID=UPI00379545EA